MREYDLPETYGGETDGIVIAGHFHETDAYVTKRPQGRDDWLITYTLSGQGYFRVSGHQTTCGAGDITLLKPGSPHVYGTVQGDTWHFVWAHFSPRFIEPRLLPSEEVSNQHLDQSDTQKRVYRAFRRILTDSRERSEYWHELCLTALREILMIAGRVRNDSSDPRIAETLRLLSQRMREQVRIEELADAAGLSPSRLSHLFKAATGESIIDRLNRMRIREAALLLAHTGRSAAEACHDVGFQNYNHFANRFVKYTGLTPRAYVKSLTDPRN